jgi:primosomal protein N' (replication factor Y)
VDLRQHWRSGERGFITAEARVAIDRALASDQVAIILHNRRGLAARIVCVDCGMTISCAACDAPYTEHPEGLRCHRCGGTIPVPTVCPACRSPRLSSRGMGTAGIASALAHAYPNVPVARVDRDTPEPPPASARIIVGTERFLHSIAPSLTRAVGAIIVIDAARFVRSDDYRATERLFQALRNVLAWSRTWDARCVIQTTAIDLPALTALQHPIANFYRSELAEREALRYPPATRLIRCTMDGMSSLTPIRNHASVERIDGPLLRRRGPHRTSDYAAIIRLHGDASDRDVVSILRALPPGVRATVDPVSLTD